MGLCVTRAIPLFLAAAISAPASPQIRNAPPVLPNPNPLRPTAKPVTYTDLAFGVWTGDDDLRADSNVWAELHFADGATQKCNLRPEHDTWANNSAHNAPPCVLAGAKTLGELKAMKIKLGYDGIPLAATREGSSSSAIFETYDNWNVDHVRVSAENPAEHRRACLLDAKGNPLARLKESNQSFPLSDAWNSC